MGIHNRILLLIIVTLMLGWGGGQAGAASSTAYSNSNINGVGVRYVTLDMNDKSIHPMVLNAQNQLQATDSLTSMAKAAGAVAAINGTYFEAYNGVPVPWGTIIKNGKVLHISQSGAVVGITSSGRLLVDRLSFDFEGYINGEFRSIPWRINHPSPETEAITIFTPEYGTVVTLSSGAKGVVVSNGRVTEIATTDFSIPASGFAIVYNAAVAYLVGERFEIGDEVHYEVKIKTTFTKTSDWDDVVCALGAGPSLMINGQVTAQGEAEGFTEAKINKNSAGRSFIGATAEGKIMIGNMTANLQQAAAVCQSLGLINAMCLDGGYSTALYYPAAGISTVGRNINNGLAFIVSAPDQGITAIPTASSVYVDGTSVKLEAYNINGNNYFKLRDLAMALNGSGISFAVAWDAARNAIDIRSNQEYSPIGGELVMLNNPGKFNAVPASASVYIDDSKTALTAYNINGNNYFKLRDVGSALNFRVNWDSVSNAINITTK
jgi:hypothetical protein